MRTHRMRRVGLVLAALTVFQSSVVAAHAAATKKTKRPAPEAAETTAAPAAAPAKSADVERRMQELEQSQKRIKELEDTVGRLNKDQRQVEVTLENQKPLAGWINDGFSLNSADGRYKLKFGAYIQADARFFIEDSEDKNVSQFTFRRARLDLQGTVCKYFDFRIMPDFAGANFVLFDAYVETNFVPWLKLRVGKFKPPVGLERLQSATSTMFIERGLPTNLVPTRDNGVQLGGELFEGALSYQLGIFNGVPDLGNSATDVNDAKDFAGRVFALPFKNLEVEPLRGLGLGIAGTYGRARGNLASPDLPGYRTTGQATFFSYKTGADLNTTAIAVGEHSRLAPQAYYYFQSFGLLGELTYSDQVVRIGNNEATVNNQAWQVAASYVLTGELASFKGVNPTLPFDPFEGNWGAVEAVARFGQLEIDREAFDKGFADPKRSARRNTEYVVGANWYLNKNIKFVLNYSNNTFTGGGSKGNRKAEDAIVTRVQLAF